MKILKVILKNIRSYEQEEINFESGISLLSGEIGSGKTTILLSIEFALFGLVKGMISSDSLLRHGEKNGSVTLVIEINNQVLKIKRSLVRTSNSIKQEPGQLTIDDVEEQLTPQELRARIVHLLDYPHEFISKSPAIVYRYTVYTPQEDMKLILFESPDSRMETIRKIFNIDKYKIIRNNTSLYIKELNARIRENKAKTEDIDELKEQVENITSRRDILKGEISKLDESINKKVIEVRDVNAEISKLDEKILEQNTNKQKLVMAKTRLSSLSTQKESLTKQIIELKDQLKEKPKTELQDLSVLTKKLEDYESAQRNVLYKKQDFLQKRAILDSRIKDSNKSIQEISSIDMCPTCRQNVTFEHKSLIKQKEQTKVNSLGEKITLIDNAIPRLNEKEDVINKRIKDNQELINKLNLDKLKIKTYNEKFELQEKFELNLKKINEEAEVEKKRVETFSLKIDTGIVSIYDEKKLLFRKKLNEQKDLEIKFASFRKESELKKEELESVKKHLDSKTKLLSFISDQKMLRDWLNSFFMNLMQLMERYVLNSILKEFNEYFQEWFRMLIEDENLSVRLNDSFTPIIEQNGYETYIQNLSGGEKTSVALAYRLALNKVINDFVSHIKTKGLLILDEPTDGFSSNQLDKLRDVLVQVQSEQIVIVSHESKLESYADKIIKISKEHHVSSVS
jgi:DNA repair protein SbcC/Rad50